MSQEFKVGDHAEIGNVLGPITKIYEGQNKDKRPVTYAVINGKPYATGTLAWVPNPDELKRQMKISRDKELERKRNEG